MTDMWHEGILTGFVAGVGACFAGSRSDSLLCAAVFGSAVGFAVGTALRLIQDRRMAAPT
jgi:hypothetical protein